jgi:hypothetical protein
MLMKLADGPWYSHDHIKLDLCLLHTFHTYTSLRTVLIAILLISSGQLMPGWVYGMDGYILKPDMKMRYNMHLEALALPLGYYMTSPVVSSRIEPITHKPNTLAVWYSH